VVLQKQNFIHNPKPIFFPPKGQISEAGISFRPSPLEDGFQPLLSLAEATSSSSTLLVSMLSEAVSVPKEEAIGRAWAKTFREPVWRIRDVYPGSRILIFTHPGSQIPDLGSRIQKQQQKREVKKNKLSYLFM
jgi:hypothetical protein